MNYLAHLHIADAVNSNLLGNLLGDFVKGLPAENFGSSIRNGIFLHRRVDQFTDSHPISRELKICFEPKARRYAPIALDMFWDHCLAKQWALRHPLSLEKFVAECQTSIEYDEKGIELPLSYRNLSQKLWAQQWLLSYQSFDNIGYALNRISQRRPRLAGLAQCITGLEQHYNELSGQFAFLYPLVLDEAARFQSHSQV
jgi:acyl carrier protein phosphodiesterase